MPGPAVLLPADPAAVTDLATALMLGLALRVDENLGSLLVRPSWDVRNRAMCFPAAESSAAAGRMSLAGRTAGLAGAAALGLPLAAGFGVLLRCSATALAWCTANLDCILFVPAALGADALRADPDDDVLLAAEGTR